MKGKFQDLKGNRYGKLTVIERKENQKGYVMWRCRCDCGGETITRASSLREGITTSCGCMRSNYRPNMNGMRFGRLLVNGEFKVINGKTYWPCDCDCGTREYLVLGSSLRRGKTTSCGCYRAEVAKNKNKCQHITKKSDSAANA